MSPFGVLLLEHLDTWNMPDLHSALIEAHAWDGRTIQRGIDIIKFCEGWPRGGDLCPSGCWTTAYGALRGLDGKRVTKNSPALTKKQGEQLLRRDLAMAEKAVHWLVGPKLTPNQFSATVSLVFNIGSGNFKASQIRSRLLRDDFEGAADIWCGHGGGVVPPGASCQAL